MAGHGPFIAVMPVLMPRGGLSRPFEGVQGALAALGRFARPHDRVRPVQACHALTWPWMHTGKTGCGP